MNSKIKVNGIPAPWFVVIFLLILIGPNSTRKQSAKKQRSSQHKRSKSSAAPVRCICQSV